MPNDRESRKRSWAMTGWSTLCAVLITALLFFSIFETRDARSRAKSPPYAVERSGERMLY